MKFLAAALVLCAAPAFAQTPFGDAAAQWRFEDSLRGLPMGQRLDLENQYLEQRERYQSMIMGMDAADGVPTLSGE